MVRNTNQIERESKLALLQELAPQYYEKIESLPQKDQNQAISNRAIANWIQCRLEQIREQLSQAKETQREYQKLRELALHTGEYCASIEW